MERHGTGRTVDAMVGGTHRQERRGGGREGGRLGSWPQVSHGCAAPRDSEVLAEWWGNSVNSAGV